MERFTYIGTYGVVVDKKKILLVMKKKGPYRGLLDLPGGGLEFGESILEALKREFIEEVCLSIDDIEWLDNMTHCSVTKEYGKPVEFYHIGLIYKIRHFITVKNCQADEEFNWYDVSSLQDNQLSPFATIALKKFL